MEAFMNALRMVILSLLTCLLVPGISASDVPTLSAVSLSATSVVGGNSLRGTVSLNMAAPFDIEVSLAADPSSVAKVPASVKIPAGSTSAPFTISTVLSKSAVVGSDTAVTIYGNYGATQHTSFTALAPVSFDQIVDRVVSRERAFVTTMKPLHPLAETYIQNLRENKDHQVIPTSDQYFLGRLDMSHGPGDQLFEDEGKSSGHRFLNPFAGLFSRRFVPQGFAQMVMLDTDFEKSNYYFNFVRQEFLGEVRCIVVDVEPREEASKGRFTGRIWVEDRDFNIVRFNGTYSAESRYSHYLHFDSWRLNLQPGVWLPSYIYSEESESKRSTPPFHSLFFKAQTRLWGYDIEGLKHPQEFTQIQIDTVEDQTDSTKNAGPVEAQRMWERLAEDNALDHLQKVGLVAPPGPVDKILQTVVNNLIITNKLEILPDVRCRVLLTSPLESFTVGHTIVVSRGLLDVLPDEPSLAMILAHELSHIALGHKINTKFAFNDRFFFPDTNTFQRLEFSRNPEDESAADRKAIELLANSPYKDKLGNAGLFLKALEARAPVLTSLIRSHLGNRLENGKSIRMAQLLASAPQLEAQRVDQIAALPLGGRIRLDPWSNQLEMMNIKRVVLLSAQEKMPFEVTPFFPYLTRLSPPGVETLALK
jgi:Peptidase family M48